MTDSKYENIYEYRGVVKKFVEQRLKQSNKKYARTSKKYDGKEQRYKFHDGFDHGYVSGQIAAFQTIIDFFEKDGKQSLLNLFDTLDKMGVKKAPIGWNIPESEQNDSK